MAKSRQQGEGEKGIARDSILEWVEILRPLKIEMKVKVTSVGRSTRTLRFSHEASNGGNDMYDSAYVQLVPI